MSEPQRVDGVLLPPSAVDLTGCRVSATYTTSIDPASGEPGAGLDATASTSAPVDGRSGKWSLALPGAGLSGEVIFEAFAPSGIRLGSRAYPAGAIPSVEIEIAAPEPLTVETSSDPTLGRRVTLNGRVLNPDGSGAPAGLLVILWGRPQSTSAGEAADPVPVLATSTSEGGYFADEWPPLAYASGYGTVAGGEPLAVTLTDGRFPTAVVLVAAQELEAPAAPGAEDCSCAPGAPPRVPGQTELTSNPAAFSADAGGGRCVDFTVPNRALEEVAFHAVVRTTEPDIKGVQLPDPTVLPEPLVSRLRQLASVSTPELRSAIGAGAPGGALRLHPEVIADQVHTGLAPAPPSDAMLERAAQLSSLRLIGQLTEALEGDGGGRVSLDGEHLVRWDDHPVSYQATTVAIGHLLTLKQVWRADGYSLGDLLYSLPLAPGQKKQIATIDWDRREATVREAAREASEALAAGLTHDRDISQIVKSTLSEHDWGESSAGVSAVGGGIGGFIGPVVFGGGGGTSSASSSAHSHNTRDVTAQALNQAQDRTSQAASSVRSQRITVVQSARQGESMRVQTEVVANHNHCHAVTMEYFEVLRHFQVGVELADVQECLFVPLAISPFTPAKALRWQDSLLPALSRRDLAAGFAALARVLEDWVAADVPTGRYADEEIDYLDGELWVVLDLPRPADTADGEFDKGQWGMWAPFLADTPENVWNETLGTVTPERRDSVWAERLAPAIAARIVAQLRLAFELDGGGSQTSVELKPTLVTPWRANVELLVSLQPELTSAAVLRSRIGATILTLAATLPLDVKLVVRRGSMRYRTEHISHELFDDYAIDEELVSGAFVDVPVRLDREERRNPREEDRRLATQLVAHLNERVEYYHQAIWRAMDPNRRYLLLDGYLAPNANGRSVASVVENRLIGIVGNALVMPVVPGTHLDPQWQSASEERASLLDLYAADAPPPRRISVPTKGVYAEAVMGACSSCEQIDDRRFWRWEESPLPDQPPAIATVSAASRRTAPAETSPDQFPAPIVGLQQAPQSPDPTGLAAALKLIGTPNLFRDLTGLDLNQQNAAQAFSTALETAQFFGNQAASLAQQQFQSRGLERNLKRIQDARAQNLITGDQARTLTESALRSAAGAPSHGPAPTSTPAVQQAIARASSAPSGEVNVTRPSGAVSVRTGDRATTGPFSFDIAPPLQPIEQPSEATCWAAAGAMLMNWRTASTPPLDIRAAADRLGGGWRAKLDANAPLSVAEVVAYTRAFGLESEAPMSYLPRGVLRLLQAHGPLWVIGDDAIADNKLAHVRIVTGISGDGTSERATVRYVDSVDGASHEMTFADFDAQMEASDPVSTNLGIMHF